MMPRILAAVFAMFSICPNVCGHEQTLYGNYQKLAEYKE